MRCFSPNGINDDDVLYYKLNFDYKTDSNLKLLFIMYGEALGFAHLPGN